MKMHLPTILKFTMEFHGCELISMRVCLRTGYPKKTMDCKHVQHETTIFGIPLFRISGQTHISPINFMFAHGSITVTTKKW